MKKSIEIKDYSKLRRDLKFNVLVKIARGLRSTILEATDNLFYASEGSDRCGETVLILFDLENKLFYINTSSRDFSLQIQRAEKLEFKQVFSINDLPLYIKKYGEKIYE